MAKPAGPACNLACEYCFYREKSSLFPAGAATRMSPEVLESFVRQYIESQPRGEVTFAWQGGEPTLLGLDFFRRVVELQARYAEGRRVKNALQTNGVLIDERWAAFLAEHAFLVGVSIDGPPQLNDRFRRDPAGGPTADRVLRAVEALKRAHVDFNTLTVVNRRNAEHPLEVYAFLKEIGSTFLQFIPLVERIARRGAGERAGAPAAPGRALAARRDRRAPTVRPWHRGAWSRPGTATSSARSSTAGCARTWAGCSCSISRRCCPRGRAGDRGSACSTSAAARRSSSSTTATCTRATTTSTRRSGSATSWRRRSPSWHAPRPRRRSGKPSGTRCPADARECAVRFACNGGCPKHRFVRARDGEPGLNYLCPAYRGFLEHAGPLLQEMLRLIRDGRSPAPIMDVLRAEDLRRALASAGRNDPCPCGSGRKFKQCCGASRSAR